MIQNCAAQSHEINILSKLCDWYRFSFLYCMSFVVFAVQKNSTKFRHCLCGIRHGRFNEWISMRRLMNIVHNNRAYSTRICLICITSADQLHLDLTLNYCQLEMCAPIIQPGSYRRVRLAMIKGAKFNFATVCQKN